MIDEYGEPELPTAFAMVEALLLSITGIAVSAPVLPGFLLCVPAFVFFSLGVIVPLVAAAALVTLAALAGAVLAMPYLLARSILGRRRRRSLARRKSPPVSPYRPAPRNQEEPTLLTAGGRPA
jgi:hypothetical protein